MHTVKKQVVRLVNNISGEEWVCEDYTNIRLIDGVEFIEVRQPLGERKFWMNKESLVKVKSS